MCHNYLGGMYLRTFGKKPALDTVPALLLPASHSINIHYR